MHPFPPSAARETISSPARKPLPTPCTALETFSLDNPFLGMLSMRHHTPRVAYRLRRIRHGLQAAPGLGQTERLRQGDQGISVSSRPLDTVGRIVRNGAMTMAALAAAVGAAR